MTNEDIIRMAKKEHGVHEEAHTFAEWKRKGYVVRRGEKALFKVKIWIFTKEQVEVEDGVFMLQDKFVMKPTAFFGESQVKARR